MRVKFNYNLFFLFLLFFILGFFAARGQTASFTFQGRLTDNSQTADGIYDFEFRLFDASTGGAVLAMEQRTGVPVTGGIFSVTLDFGANFDGSGRFLEISVRQVGRANSFVTLAPRQAITSAPYAIQSLTATNALQLGGITANQFILTSDPRLNDDRNPLPNSVNYIQNTTSTQTNSNFNISGNGNLGGTLSADTVNSTNGYNIGNSRVLSIAGSNNLFLGLNAGAAKTTGRNNSFFGTNAGLNNTFVGGNSFFGSNAGQSNTLGFLNSFFGFEAGRSNTTGILNSFFGEEAGVSNTTGGDNSFFGQSAGRENTGGANNTFIGVGAGFQNKTGSNNTLIGAFADVVGNNLNFATAIGAGSKVSTDNTIQLGRTNGLDQVIAPGGIALRNGSLRLREPNDLNHSITYDISINGIRFTAFDGFRWVSSRNERTQMDLTSAGDLFISASYRQFSDARYKTNVQTFPGALETVRRLRGVTFNWKSEQNDNRPTQIGFIAQEIEEILPSLVTTDENGNKSVSYSNIVPVLVEAVKEQQSQIEAQKAQIKEQKQQLQDQQLLIENLRRIVCRSYANEKICQPQE